ncbi:MAG: hypothetical protein U1F27_04365 [Turneriella sp.]
MSLSLPTARFLHVLLAFLVFFTGACAGGQVRNELELEEAKRRAQAGEERGWSSLERTVRSNDADADPELQKKALAAIGSIKAPRAELILKENLSNRVLRGEAAAGWINQRNDTNKDQIDAVLIESARNNAREFSGLSKEEIRALGATDHPEAVRLLKQQIGKDPNKDELAVEALGKIIHRRSRSAIDALPELQYAGLTPGIFPFPEKVMHIGSLWGATISVEEIKGADTPGEAMEPAPKESPDDLDPEKVLLQFLSGDGMPEVKDKAVQSIASGHESGSAYLLKLAARRSLPLKARVAILDYLTRYAVNAQDKSMINKFYALRRSSAGDRQFVASIDLSLRLLGNAFGRAIGTGGTVRYTRAVTTDGYDSLPKETDIITLKQKPYPEYSGADVRTNLKKALKYYHLDPAMAERMQRRVSELLNQPENRESPERNLIFAALGRLYPDKDFYVLKKQGQDAFAKPGYFTTTLRIVTASQRGKSWQIAALQRLWSLSYNEADLLRQIYLRDGKLLQQRMRL